MNLGCGHCRQPSPSCKCPASVQRAEPIVALRDAGATIRENLDAIRFRLLRTICDNARWDEIVALGIERATSVGAQQYGDTSYYKTTHELLHEGDCELADFLFYIGVIEERGE